jgi:hypothetical protein
MDEAFSMVVRGMFREVILEYCAENRTQTFVHEEGCINKFNAELSPMWIKPRRYSREAT